MNQISGARGTSSPMQVYGDIAGRFQNNSANAKSKAKNNQALADFRPGVFSPMQERRIEVGQVTQRGNVASLRAFFEAKNQGEGQSSSAQSKDSTSAADKSLAVDSETNANAQDTSAATANNTIKEDASDVSKSDSASTSKDSQVNTSQSSVKTTDNSIRDSHNVTNSHNTTTINNNYYGVPPGGAAGGVGGPSSAGYAVEADLFLGLDMIFAEQYGCYLATSSPAELSMALSTLEALSATPLGQQQIEQMKSDPDNPTILMPATHLTKHGLDPNKDGFYTFKDSKTNEDVQVFVVKDGDPKQMLSSVLAFSKHKDQVKKLSTPESVKASAVPLSTRNDTVREKDNENKDDDQVDDREGPIYDDVSTFGDEPLYEDIDDLNRK